MRKAIRREKSPRLLASLFAAVIGLTTAVAGFADLPDGPVTLEQVARGRALVTGSICANCHNAGRTDPGDPQWLAGFVTSRTGPGKFQIGSFTTYARNLTPDNATGLGRISARQIFNSLRYGLKPGDTPDVVITSDVPGQGNFPATPRYLAPPMPWPVFRHLPDADLWAMAAYLKHGIKAVNNKVPDSQGPPDFWASTYTEGLIGPFPLAPFPAASEAFQP
jgi:mono/diheme cytochrome c family protein